jgi:hypothetical protein
VISEHNLEKLLTHNFIDLFTRDELIRATKPQSSKWESMSNLLKDNISEIKRYELEHPLGINNIEYLWTGHGYWNYCKKEFYFPTAPDVEFTLEDLKFYCKLLTFLKIADTL